ncbi:MAG: pitrilysin family protein [Candidatus Uhrbacteria bacterium]
MFTEHKLANGARVLLAPAQDTQAVCVYALFPVGSRYETLKQNGASHFVEHMMFKGTKRRPTTLHISRDLDRIGAEYNAFTSKEYTGYYIKANAAHLDLALDMLSDMCFHSTYKEEEFVRERKVILEEIHLYEDNPSWHLDDIFEGLLYRTHPLGRLISGTRDSVLGLTRDDLAAYRDRHYHPSRMVLTLAGNLDGNALAAVQRTFGRVRKAKRVVRSAQPFTGRPHGPAVHIYKKETSQAHLAIGVPTFGNGDSRKYAAVLLANILGGTMSSRLFIAVRERLGLAYSVRASFDAYHDTGSFTVSAGLDPERLDRAIRVIMRELTRIRAGGVTAPELKRAKENIEGRMVLALEDSFVRADLYGKQALLNERVYTPEQRIARLHAVTREQVLKVTRDLLRTDRLHLALIGKFDDAKRFEKLLKV